MKNVRKPVAIAASELADDKTPVGQLIPFGQYRGQPVEVLRNHPSYLDWLMGQDWFRERYRSFYQIIVNNFAEPSETPEHNRLQTRFLADGFCRGLLAALRWEPLTDPQKFIRGWLVGDDCLIDRRRENIRRLEIEIELSERRIADAANRLEELRASRPRADLPRAYPSCPVQDAERAYASSVARLAEVKEKLARAKQALVEAETWLERPTPVTPQCEILDRAFEVDGWDVVFRGDIDGLPFGISASMTVAIEIKPDLSDNYPAVLRQVQANRRAPRHHHHDAHVLVFKEYTASGASLDQVRAIFRASQIDVVSMADIEAAAPQPA
jgi:hypothetical protein